MDVGEHEFDAVFQIDPGGAGIIVHGHQIGLGIAFLDLAHHALGHNMIGQTAKGLGDDYVLGTGSAEQPHFGGDQPSLPHFDPLIQQLVGLFPELVKFVQRVEDALFADDPVHFLLHPENDPVPQLAQPGPGIFEVIQFAVHDSVDDTVQAEVQKPRQHRLAALGEQEVLQMIVGQGGILDIDLPHDAHLGLFVSGPRQPGEGL